jgi:hypothetical protein
VQDQTINKIRGLLTEEQKQKYIQARDRRADDSQSRQQNYNKYVGSR